MAAAHGTVTRYMHWKCRCSLCVRAQSAYRLRKRLENPEKYRARSRDYDAKNRSVRREKGWRGKGLDLTWEGWCSYLERYGNRCEYPGCEVVEGLVPDHDHDTGQLRGILCQRHNRALGFFGDNIAGFREAISYLEMTLLRLEAENG